MKHFAVHLKLIQHCKSTTPQYKLKKKWLCSLSFILYIIIWKKIFANLIKSITILLSFEFYWWRSWIFLFSFWHLCFMCLNFFFFLIKCVFKIFNLGIRSFSELSQNIPRWQSLGNHGFKAGFNFHASKQFNALGVLILILTKMS